MQAPLPEASPCRVIGSATRQTVATAAAAAAAAAAAILLRLKFLMVTSTMLSAMEDFDGEPGPEEPCCEDDAKAALA